MNRFDEPEPVPGEATETSGEPEAVTPDEIPAVVPHTTAETPEEIPLGPKKIGLVASLAAIIIVLDQVSKFLVVANLDPVAAPKRILGGVVYLSLFRNAGAAFSTATGLTWLLALVAIVVVVVIIRMAGKLRSTAWAIALGLVLGGAIGNLIDRVFRSPGFLRGHVVDFISLFEPDGRHFAVFNLADSGITLGAVALVITAILGIDMDGRRGQSRPQSPAKEAKSG